jgi:3-dehydro-4-phosphotetronate decarboxylase
MSVEMHAELKNEICRVGASLYARGYVHASAGNISVRLPEGGFIITPTDACLGTLDPSRLATIDANGVQTNGDRASKTLALHRRIYAADLDAPITPYFVMKVGHVPLIPYHPPGDPAVADLVAQRIAAMHAAGTPLRAVMLERLGPNVWHRSPAEASAVLEELEETARLWLMTRATSLTEAQIAALRQKFGARW